MKVKKGLLRSCCFTYSNTSHWALWCYKHAYMHFTETSKQQENHKFLVKAQSSFTEIYKFRTKMYEFISLSLMRKSGDGGEKKSLPEMI